MNDETQALHAALHRLAYLVDENVPVAQQGRELNSALAYAFELLEEIRVPGTPKSDAIKKWARDNSADYNDVSPLFDEFLSAEPKHLENMRKINQILNA